MKQRHNIIASAATAVAAKAGQEASPLVFYTRSEFMSREAQLGHYGFEPVPERVYGKSQEDIQAKLAEMKAACVKRPQLARQVRWWDRFVERTSLILVGVGITFAVAVVLLYVYGDNYLGHRVYITKERK